MFSLTSLPSNRPAPTGASEATGGSADTPPAKDGFSSLLSAMQPEGTSAATPPAAAATAPTSAQLGLTQAGSERQAAAATGKTLPVELPVAQLQIDAAASVTPELSAALSLAEGEGKPRKGKAGESDEPAAADDLSLISAEITLAVAPLPGSVAQPMPLPPVEVAAAQAGQQQNSDAPSGEPAGDSRLLASHLKSASQALATLAAEKAPAAAASQPQSAGQEKGDAPAPFVALQVAEKVPAEQTASGLRGAVPESEATPSSPELASIKPKAAKALSTDGTAEPLRAAIHGADVPVADSGAASAAREAAPSFSPSVSAVQDLARIVDRLASAREALLPAAAAMSIDHAEFGEMSLRFEQRSDGALAVQLSASNPEAHEAVRAAVAADRSHFGGSDAGAGNGGQGSPSGQQSAGASSGQPQARGGSAERDTHGGSAGNRQEQPGQRQGSSRDGAPKHTDPRRDGVFA